MSDDFNAGWGGEVDEHEDLRSGVSQRHAGCRAVSQELASPVLN